MERLNMFEKSIFGLLILTVVLISGCINSNELTQKTQPPDETKIINLHAQQIILDDNEIKELLGATLTKKEQNIISEKEDDKIFGHVLSGISVGYGIPKMGDNNVSILLFVSPTIDVANKSYQSIELEVQNKIGKIISNKINIGDAGELYSVVDAKDKREIGTSYIIFRKNNIIVLVMSTPDIRIETLLELAKKQEAKISRMLSVIK